MLWAGLAGLGTVCVGRNDLTMKGGSSLILVGYSSGVEREWCECLFVICADDWCLVQVWLQFYFLQFMTVCEVCSNNTAV